MDPLLPVASDALPKDSNVLKRKCCDWPKLNDEESNNLVKNMKLWNLEYSNDVPKLIRKFCTKTFLCAIDFLNAAAKIAESFQHHPDIHITSWNTVTIEIYTHSLLGLTQNDFDLANEIDKIEVVYSNKWLKENDTLIQKNN